MESFGTNISMSIVRVLSSATALIALHLVALVDFLAGLGIDIACADALAGLAVQRVETDLLFLAHGWHHGDRAGHERELEVTLPESARCRHVMSIELRIVLASW
jgi:hypothetical protein